MAYYRAVAQAAASTPERIGVIVVNLGTPDSPSYLAVQRYLAEFLGDRRVIDQSRLFWLPILYGAILPFRPIRTTRNYRKVWMQGGSPLAVYSQRLTGKIATLLQARHGERVRVELAMTYGNPSIAKAVKSLADQNVKRLLVLPLYPQYCSSTTGSVFDRTARVLQRWRWLPETRFVNDYYNDGGYLDAIARRIEGYWSEAGERSHLLLSYHGIPALYVAEGDPYQAQAEATTRAVVARLGLSAAEYSHCYQSRFGPVLWLQPYTEDTLKELAKRGVRKLTVVSPSFAVDCLETLEEVAMEYREQFMALGGETFGMVPALNDDQVHAEVLANIADRQLQGWI
jgi:ferrochelatase